MSPAFSPPAWYRAHDGGVTIRVKVTPRAHREEIRGVDGDELRVCVCTAPVDDAANRAVIALLAKTLGIPKRAVTIRRGARSRHKELFLDGCRDVDLTTLLAT